MAGLKKLKKTEQTVIMRLWKSYEKRECRVICQASKLRRGGRMHRCTPNCWNVYWWPWNSALGEGTGYPECTSLPSWCVISFLLQPEAELLKKNSVSVDWGRCGHSFLERRWLDLETKISSKVSWNCSGNALNQFHCQTWKTVKEKYP